MTLDESLVEVSPKCRITHFKQAPALSIAQPDSRNPSDCNYTEACAYHDSRRNPTASRFGRPQDYGPQGCAENNKFCCESHT